MRAGPGFDAGDFSQRRKAGCPFPEGMDQAKVVQIAWCEIELPS
jgi:hypothetical protein